MKKGVGYFGGVESGDLSIRQGEEMKNGLDPRGERLGIMQLMLRRKAMEKFLLQVKGIGDIR